MKKSYIFFSLILFFTLLFTTSVFAYDDPTDSIYNFPDNIYPSADFENSFENSEYIPIVYKVADTTHLILLKCSNNYPFSNYASVSVLSDGGIEITYGVSANLVARIYVLSDDGLNWEFRGSYSISKSKPKTFSNSSMPTFLYSQVDIYDTDGNLFFPEPPILTVEGMVAQETPRMAEKIIQEMKIILPVFLAIFGTLLVLYLIKSKNLLHL